MKKSSLGKRSSLSQQTCNMLYNNKPSQRRNNDSDCRDSGKKSFLLKPGFSSKNGRSSSVDREVNNTFMKKEPLRRSRSALNMDVSGIRREPLSDSKRNTNIMIGSTSTPCQSGMYNVNAVHSTGGSRVRSSCPTSESRRASSIGEKTRKKESRPIGEKSFQAEAEEKVLQFFSRNDEGAAILNNGHIKPMNTNRLIDMVNYLVKFIDPRMVIKKANFAEEIVQLAKLYMYKGRMERSLIISVSAAHNWPYVLAFLLWLVELCTVREHIDEFEAMYPTDIQDTEMDINDINFRLLTPHLLNAFNAQCRGSNGEDEINNCIQELKMAENINDEDIERLERQCAMLEKESCDMEEISQGQKLMGIKNRVEAMRIESIQRQKFIADGEEFLNQMIEKEEEDVDKIKQLESSVGNLNQRLEELQLRVNNQKVSYMEKQRMKQETEKLKEEIEYLNRCLKEYSDLSYAEDLKVTAVRSEFENLCLAYNKQVVEYSFFLPKLEQTKINHNILHQNAAENNKIIDEVLRSIRESLNTKQSEIDRRRKEVKLEVEKLENEILKLKEKLVNLNMEFDRIYNEIHEKTKSIEKFIEMESSNIGDLEAKKWKIVESMPDTRQLENDVKKAKMQLKEMQEEYKRYTESSIKTIKERSEKVKIINKKLQEEKENWNAQYFIEKYNFPKK